MKRGIRRQNDRREDLGFTFAESLIAILIVGLVTAVVAGGIPVAQQAYERIVDKANAEIYLSTALAQLRDELSYGAEPKDVKKELEEYFFANDESGDSGTGVGWSILIQIEDIDDNAENQDVVTIQAIEIIKNDNGQSAVLARLKSPYTVWLY